MNKLSEFFSDDGLRSASVMFNTGAEILQVMMYENGLLQKAIDLPNKSVNYAEDAAENWVQYVGAFAK